MINNPKCNRTACSNPHNFWWNKSTNAFYCFQCMKMITQYEENKHLFEERKPIDRPTVSIDRQKKLYCLFDCFTPIGDFKPYTDEQEVINLATEYFKTRTTEKLEIVYPRITSIKYTYGKK